MLNFPLRNSQLYRGKPYTLTPDVVTNGQCFLPLFGTNPQPLDNIPIRNLANAW